MSDDTNNDSLNDVRKAPESKPAGEKEKKAADKGKKAVKAVKKLKNMGKLGTVGLFIAAIIIIIFIAIGIYGFITTLPGLASEKIVETAKRTDAKVAGPIPLPTKRRIYCVLRSPHVDKKSREHFEMRTHKRIIDIYDPTQQTTEELSRLDLPAGVDIEVKL